MIKNDVNQLLEKYWECETTLDEEQILKEYFASNQVSEEHLQYQPLFQQYLAAAADQSKVDVKKLIAGISTEGESMSTIDEMLEDYWNGESSLADEEELRDYFKSGAVAKKHIQYKPLFNYFGREQSLSSANLDVDEILKKQQATSDKKEAIVRPLGARLRSMAAVGAILVVAGLAFFTSGMLDSTLYKGKNTVLNEEAQAEEALQMTKEALAFISTKLGKGEKVMKEELKQFDKLNIFKN